MASGDWTAEEIALITRDYLEMLVLELAGQPYVKADHRRRLLPFLNGRSEGSIEFKHQNISAILCENNLPFIDGYKPKFNYQDALRVAVLAQLNANAALIALISRTADRVPDTLPAFTDLPSLRKVVVPAPPLPNLPTEKIVREPIPIKVDYVAREARNRDLGKRGEEFAYRYEKARLTLAGRKTLADTVEWVSESRGDGLGYDIASFDLEERPFFIEVKTTNLSALHPFFVTERELAVSRQLGNQYRLYRIHEFSRSPLFFELSGDLSAHLRLDPIVYRAMIT